MSASLVGSEMCIRDSVLHGLQCLIPVPARGALVLACLHASLPRVSPSTVSYTHLTLPTICSV
eukprot:2588391-Alexandrium_andersonii.AAC.1